LNKSPGSGPGPGSGSPLVSTQAPPMSSDSSMGMSGGQGMGMGGPPKTSPRSSPRQPTLPPTHTQTYTPDAHKQSPLQRLRSHSQQGTLPNPSLNPNNTNNTNNHTNPVRIHPESIRKARSARGWLEYILILTNTLLTWGIYATILAITMLFVLLYGHRVPILNNVVYNAIQHGTNVKYVETIVNDISSGSGVLQNTIGLSMGLGEL